jgi:hypothetical protein
MDEWSTYYKLLDWVWHCIGTGNKWDFFGVHGSASEMGTTRDEPKRRHCIGLGVLELIYGLLLMTTKSQDGDTNIRC